MDRCHRRGDPVCQDDTLGLVQGSVEVGDTGVHIPPLFVSQEKSQTLLPRSIVLLRL